jgi:hypothetical protein
VVCWSVIIASCVTLPLLVFVSLISTKTKLTSGPLTKTILSLVSAVLLRYDMNISNWVSSKFYPFGFCWCFVHKESNFKSFE